jgi:hypothetical protein
METKIETEIVSEPYGEDWVMIYVTAKDLRPGGHKSSKIPVLQCSRWMWDIEGVRENLFAAGVELASERVRAVAEGVGLVIKGVVVVKEGEANG